MRSKKRKQWRLSQYKNVQVLSRPNIKYTVSKVKFIWETIIERSAVTCTYTIPQIEDLQLILKTYFEALVHVF